MLYSNWWSNQVHTPSLLTTSEKVALHDIKPSQGRENKEDAVAWSIETAKTSRERETKETSCEAPQFLPSSKPASWCQTSDLKLSQQGPNGEERPVDLSPRRRQTKLRSRWLKNRKSAISFLYSILMSMFTADGLTLDKRRFQAESGGGHVTMVHRLADHFLGCWFHIGRSAES